MLLLFVSVLPVRFRVRKSQTAIHAISPVLSRVHSMEPESKGLFTCSNAVTVTVTVTVPIKVYIVWTVTSEISLESILPVKQPVSIRTVLNVDSDGDGNGNSIGICEHTLI